MSNIIDQTRKYFGRLFLSDSEYINAKSFSWKELQKEFARINIDSILVKLEILPDSKLLLPIVICRKDINEYDLVKSITDTGLQLFDKEISFSDFNDNYKDEFLILEKKPFIDNKSSLSLKIMVSFRWLIYSVLIMAVFIVFWLSSLDSIFLLLFSGLTISWYYRELESNKNVDSPLCIEKGIFSCKKDRSYTLLGIPFSEIGIIYFSGSILAFSISGVSWLYIFISLLTCIFCLYAIFLQVFKEKKICIICWGIYITTIAHMIYSVIHRNDYEVFIYYEEIVCLLSYIIMICIIMIGSNKEISEELKKSKDFDKIMSEWVYVKSVSQPSTISLPNSDLIIGDRNAKKVIKLVIHMGCKHCPDALREMINLVLLDESYSLHLFIKSNRKEIDIAYFNNILDSYNAKNYNNLFEAFMDWKQSKRIPNKEFLKKDEYLINHQKILQDISIQYYPTILYGELNLSIFPRCYNLKVAMKNL